MEENKNEEVRPVEEVKQEEIQNNIELKKNKCKSNKQFVIIIVVLAMALTFGCGIMLGKELFESKKDNNNQNESEGNTTSLDDNQNDKNETNEDTKKENVVVDDNQDNNESEKTQKESIENENTDIKEKMQIPIETSDIRNIMSQLNGIIVSNEKLFSSNYFDINDLSINEILVTAFSKMNINSICSPNEKNTHLSLDSINKVISKYLNKKIYFDDIKKLDGHSVSVFGQYDYEYRISISGTDIVVSNVVCGSEGGFEIFYLEKVVNSEIKDDYMYLFSKVAFGQNENGKVNYYKDFNKTSGIIESYDGWYDYLGGGKPDSTIIPSYDKYNTYKYTFKLIGDEYYFKSIELVK